MAFEEASNEFQDYEAITLDRGVLKKIIKEGPGVTSPIAAGSTVKVHYVGTLVPSGEKFDSSRDRDDCFSFKIGKGTVIKAWDVGVATMNIGETCELICRHDYAYGETGSPPKIPPNATLKFEVELIDIEEPAETPKEKLALATKHRLLGNEQFGKGDYASAFRSYERGLEFVNYEWGVDEEEDKKLMKQSKFSLLSNAAMAGIKIMEYKKVVDYCQRALELELDQDQSKILYRLGVGYSGLKEYDLALSSLKKASEILPDDAIKREIISVTKLRNEYLNNEKQMFKRMFQ